MYIDSSHVATVFYNFSGRRDASDDPTISSINVNVGENGTPRYVLLLPSENDSEVSYRDQTMSYPHTSEVTKDEIPADVIEAIREGALWLAPYAERDHEPDPDGVKPFSHDDFVGDVDRFLDDFSANGSVIFTAARTTEPPALDGR